MKRFLAMVPAAALAALTACSVSAPVPKAPSAAPVQPEPGATRATGSASGSAGTPPSSVATSSATSSAGGTKAACELFNSLFADYAAVPAGDPEGYEDIYLRAEDAKDTVSGDLRGLFAALGLLAIDRSGAVGREPAQESKDAVRDAVFANAGTCTSAGVTLAL
jgi:hypothetical protein